MLKQSIVQEKLNDLSSSQLPSHVPQWSRVQLGKHITTNLKRNNKVNLISSINNANNVSIEQLHPSQASDISVGNFAGLQNNTMDPTQRLRYLEKNIKFIQEQHMETLTALHIEMDKLRIENRDLHFKLVNANGSDNFGNGERDKKTNASSNDPILEKKLMHIVNETAHEQNLDKRLNHIKSQYDSQKYEELVIRLRDAENKNQFLTNLVKELQEKRNANSAYRPSHLAEARRGTISSANNASKIIGLHNLYSIEPLKVCVKENETPREPSFEECEALIKKLFDLCKQQKQQISNMKAVLKDMLHTENLSNQGILMTRDVLENTDKFNQYLSEANLKKLDSHPTTFVAQKTPSSATRVPITSKYNQHVFGVSNVTGIFLPNTHDSSGSNSNTSTVHLPPIVKGNSNKFTERQRRTQILQKQRLKKEYFQ